MSEKTKRQSLRFDMSEKKRVKFGKHLVYRFPVHPDSGLNSDLSPLKGSQEYSELSDKITIPKKQDGCAIYFHGLLPERLNGIMAEGGMRPSKTNITKKRVGVYACDASENWMTPLSYTVAIPLGNDGLFYQFVFELRIPLDKVTHNSAMYTDHVLESKSTRIVALRVFVTEFNEWRAGDGFYARPHWDVHLEYHPGEVQGE